MLLAEARLFSTNVLISTEELKKPPLKPMEGPQCKSIIRRMPYLLPSVHLARYPYAFREQVKAELEFMVNQAIIKPASDKPSDWCHLLIVVPKDKGIRITVDLKNSTAK